MFAFVVAIGSLVCGDAPEDLVRLVRLNGETVSGKLEGITADGVVRLAGDKTESFNDVDWVIFADRNLPQWPEGPQIVFANGDRLAGKALASDGRLLSFQMGTANGEKDQPLSVPLSRLDRLIFRRVAREQSDAWNSPPGEQRRKDRLLLTNRDELIGSLVLFDAKTGLISFEVNSKQKQISVTELLLLAFNTELASSRRPEKNYWKLVLADGSRLSLASLTWEKGELRGETLFKANIHVASTQVVALYRIRIDQIAIGELKPGTYRYTPWLTESRGWQADCDPNGSQLALYTRTAALFFDRGIYQPANSELSYNLDSRFTQLHTWVGIQQNEQVRGLAKVRIRLDGKDAKGMDGSMELAPNAPRFIRCDLSGCKELKLVVDWGEGGSPGGAVIWGDPRLFKK